MQCSGTGTQDRARHTVGVFVETELRVAGLSEASRIKYLELQCIFIYVIYKIMFLGLGKIASRCLWVPVGSSVK